MTKKPYKRKTGDFEIRVLKDGRVVMIAPDQELMDLAETIKTDDNQLADDVKREEENAKTEHTSEQSKEPGESE